MASHQQRTEIRDGMRIDWDVPITMDDGIVLRADVFRPVKDGKFPVILSYGPYAKNLAFQDGYPSAWQRMAEKHPDVTAGSSNLYQSWEVVDPEKWVPHDYICIRVDSRGAGCSPGFIDHFSPRETKDFYDCIEWAGVQPWSNGKVGLNGISYYGINQWHVASLQPPHLAAMCIWEGAADWYRDMTHHGGILSTFWENWYDMQVKTVQYGAGDQLQSTEITKSILLANPDLKGIFGANEGSALGVINGKKELGSSIVVIGYDSGAAQKAAIMDGSMAGAITQNPVGIGYETVKAAIAALKGETLPKVIDTGFFWYDKTNMDAPEIAAVLYD